MIISVKRIIITGLLSILFFTAFSQSAIIKGKASTFKGETITFNTYKDYITLEEKVIAKAVVDTGGNFSVEVSITEPIFIFTYLGIYKGHLHLEPRKTYNVVLPDKQEKTAAEKANPFFEYTEFMIGISKGGMYEINFMIKSFDNSYFAYFNKLAMNVNAKTNPKELDRAITEMEKPWLNTDNEYFKQYVYYRIGMLRLLAYQYKSKAISAEYFRNKKVYYNQIAYMELFKQVYDKYFIFFSTTPQGKQIFDDINKQKSYSSLRKTLRTDDVLSNDTLLEAVVLKNIYDNFYSDKFSKEALLVLLDSLSTSTTISIHKEIAKNIREKTTRLMPGYSSPSFNLPDRNGKMVNLADFKGKYVYLNFCSCSSYSCFKEFDMLQRLNEKYKNKIAIVTIVCDGTADIMNNYLSKNTFDWLFLHFNDQNEVLNQYRVKAYPIYFLIDKDGKLIYSPSPSPAEDFESLFQKYLKSKEESLL